jgi:riboflavin synthase
MFTGIVESRRPVTVHEGSRGGLALGVDLGPCAAGVSVGDSIAVLGCCLTVEALDAGVARFHLMGETLGLTRFGALRVGDDVNVERSLRVGDQLGGHFVSGHLDGLGEVFAKTPAEGQTDLTVRVPPGLERFVVPKGSIAIDGVSLTVAHVLDRDVTVCLIPHTLEVTTLGSLSPGDAVHLEMDMIGKWVQRLLVQP